MNPLNELRGLLHARGPSTSGTIIEALGTSRYRIRASNGGAIEAVAVGNAAFVAGEEILIRDGVILGRLKPSANVPVYHV